MLRGHHRLIVHLGFALPVRAETQGTGARQPTPCAVMVAVIADGATGKYRNSRDDRLTVCDRGDHLRSTAAAPECSPDSHRNSRRFRSVHRREPGSPATLTPEASPRVNARRTASGGHDHLPWSSMGTLPTVMLTREGRRRRRAVTDPMPTARAAESRTSSWVSVDAMPLQWVWSAQPDIRRVRLEMSRWNFVAMGQAGLTGSTRKVAEPVARSIARRTGRPEREILSLIGAVFLAITVVDFLRNVDSVIIAGRTGRRPPNAAPAAPGAHP